MIVPDTPGTIWLEVDSKIARQFRMLRWLIPGLGVMVLFVSWFVMEVLPVEFVLITMTLAGFLLIFLNRLSRQRIGIKGDLLLLDNGRGRIKAGEGKRIRYSTHHIAIDDVSIMLRTCQPLFVKEQLMEYVYPILRQADRITPGQMQWNQIRQKPLHAVAVLAVVLALVFFLIFSAGKLG